MGEKRIDLKPCPFCGETRFLRVDDKETFYKLQGEAKDGFVTIMIRCEKCNVYMWDHSRHIRDYDTRLGLIVEKWNRRA